MIAQNLVENAVKYNTPGGRIRVEARAVDGRWK
jgi:signal transduction histidine kinase